MKKMFLCSYFKNVSNLLKDFINEDLKGKTVTFIPTAGNVEKVNFFVGSGKKALEKLGMIVEELDIAKATTEEIENKLNKNNIIYVTGGNTFYLLQELKKKGADKIIEMEIKSEKLYIGESAGAIIASPNIEYVKKMDDATIANELKDYESLNLVDFYPLPHYTNIPFKKTVEKIIQEYENKIKLYPISNSEVIFINENVVTKVTK
jgi:dipeptidase E